MPDIDSAGARSRQNVTSYKRAQPKRKTKPRVRTPAPERRPVSYFNRVGRTSGAGRRSSRRSNDNGRSGAIYRRRGRSNSSSDSRSSSVTSRSAPKTPPPPTAKLVKPPAPPKPPDLNTYLKGDSTYQRQVAAYAKSLADFQADQGLASTDYQTNYGNTRRDIGLAKTDALGDLENDFASRGLLKSSLYTEGLGDLNQQYQNQYTDLDKQRTSFFDQLAQDLVKYRGEQGVGQQNARAEAIRRRAEKYNL